MDDYQTLDTDPYEQGVSPEEGSENVGSESEDNSSENESAVSAEAEGMSLADINELLGRKGDNEYRSLEDAKKGLQNLKSLVGKKELSAPKPQNVDEKYGYMATKIFGLENPDAKDYLDVIVPYARANKLTLDEAWETKFADVFTKSESQKDSTVIKPTRQVRSATPNELQKKVDSMSAEELKDSYASIMRSQE